MCVFTHKGQEYLADITLNMDDWAPEVMIFKSRGGQFTLSDARGVYKNTDVDFSPAALEDCILEFVSA